MNREQLTHHDHSSNTRWFYSKKAEVIKCHTKR